MKCLIVATVLVLVGAPSPAQAADDDSDLEWGKFAWTNGDFVQANTLLSRHRTKSGTGQDAELDYMIATSWCRLPGMRDKGSALLNWLTKQEDVSSALHAKAQLEWKACASSVVPKARPLALEKGAEVKAQGDNRPVRRDRLPS